MSVHEIAREMLETKRKALVIGRRQESVKKQHFWDQRIAAVDYLTELLDKDGK